MTFLISYRVYMTTRSFRISLFKGTLYVDKIQLRYKIADITQALPIATHSSLPADRFHTERGGRFDAILTVDRLSVGALWLALSIQ